MLNYCLYDAFTNVNKTKQHGVQPACGWIAKRQTPELKTNLVRPATSRTMKEKDASNCKQRWPIRFDAMHDLFMKQTPILLSWPIYISIRFILTTSFTSRTRFFLACFAYHGRCAPEVMVESLYQIKGNFPSIPHYKQRYDKI